MTSGEDAYKTLKAGKYADLGEKCYYLGPGKDEHLMEGVPLEVVDNVSEADIILAAGTREAFDTLEPYKGLLDKAATNSPPMICVNPDYIVHIQGKPMFCAGALASLYEERGGTVFYHGKPHPSVYRAIFDKFDGIPRESFLAIGDSFHTDIQGAQGVGISSAFVPGGIHCKELEVSYGHLPKESLLRGLCKKEGLDPTFVLPGLIWQQED
ncbi:MAG: TIGR01459 family HAD-type hydrolase [Alphaproteobacteria bacterium]|nr:TIGR01459 family HAD-type hydrolase [Alphaproteobacteria bacterium]